MNVEIDEPALASRSGWLDVPQYLLYALPVLAVGVIIADAVAVRAVRAGGLDAAYPAGGAPGRMMDADRAAELTTFTPLTLILAGLAISLAVVGWRSSRSTGPAFATLGSLTVLLSWVALLTFDHSPLVLSILYTGGDVIGTEQVPGPFWYRPARVVLLGLLVIGTLLAAALSCRTAIGRRLRDRAAPRPERSRLATAASLAVMCGTFGPFLIVSLTGLAVAGDLVGADGGAYYMRARFVDAYLTMWWLMLLPFAAVAGAGLWIAVRLRRGSVPNPAGSLVVAGAVSAAGLPLLVVATSWTSGSNRRSDWTPTDGLVDLAADLYPRLAIGSAWLTLFAVALTVAIMLIPRTTAHLVRS